MDPKLSNYPRSIAERRNHFKQPGSITTQVKPSLRFPMPNLVKRIFGR